MQSLVSACGGERAGHQSHYVAPAASAGHKPNILMESRAHHTKLALAEAGLGIAIISTSVQTHRYALRTVKIMHKRKPILEPLAVVWDKRRTLPRYAQDFCESLAVHMRKIFSHHPLRGRHRA